MSMLEQLIEIAKALPVEDQQRLLELAERLQQGKVPKTRRNMKGVLAHLGIHLDEDDVREVRREAWLKRNRNSGE